MFDPLRDPLLYALVARERLEAAHRRAAYERLARGLRRLGGGGPGPGERLVRWTGALLVRLGYRLIPLPEPVPLPPAAAPPARAAPRAGTTGRAPVAARPGRRACRRPAARLPFGLPLAGE
jgi:hypothetical protein